MVENGSNPGVNSLSSNFPHEHFVELCALSTTEELTAAERAVLDDHVASCADCRELRIQYETVICEAIPAMVGTRVAEQQGTDPDRQWSLGEAEASLMQLLDGVGKSSSGVNNPPTSVMATKSLLPSWSYAVAASLLIVFSCLIAYRIGLSHNRTAQFGVLTRSGPVASYPVSPDLGENRAKNQKSVPGRDLDVMALRHQLQESLKEIAILKAQRAMFQSETTKQHADLAQSVQNREELNRQLAKTQANVQDLQERLQLLMEQHNQTKSQISTAESIVDQLHGQLDEKDQQIAQDKDLLLHDRDIRDLISARDLYIAEIYDVGKKGETNKPFGRVFYTKGKSLVFYAYDLDQQPGLKRASTFQAWGRRGSDPAQSVKLGMFYQDDAANKRWVLKASDPKTLAQIDAVFVTVETKPETAKPSGKPLLFTYLRIPPNHP